MNSEEIKKTEDHLDDLEKRTREQLAGLNQYLNELDNKYLISYENIKFMVRAGSAYGFVLLLFGLSDLMQEKWIFGSIYIAVAVFLFVLNFRSYRRNRKFYKEYFLDRENVEKEI